MNFKQLEAFRMVVKLGTVTKAAHFLHTQQPSISRMITDLEYVLGFALFTRTKGKLYLTKSGEMFYEKVDEHFANLNQLSHYAQSIRADITKSLRVVSAPALSCGLVTDVIGEFYKKHTDYMLHLNTHSSERIMQLMRDKKFDLGFCLATNTHYDLDMEILGNLYTACILPKNHPLACNKIIEIEHLTGQNIILPDLQYAYATTIEKKLQTKNISCNIVGTAMLSSVATRMVRAGMGIALTEPVSSIDYIPDQADKDIVVRPLNSGFSFSYWAIYNKSLTDTQMIQDLVLRIQTKMNIHFKNFYVH